MNMELFGIEIKRKPKQKNRMEFSKKILVIAWISGMAMILFACWLTYKMVIDGHSGDTSLISIILTGGFAEITAGTSFYYWKSRAENMIKLRKKYDDDTIEYIKDKMDEP